MVQMLANENASNEGASVAEQVDMVVCAQKWLKQHPESCKVHSGLRDLNEKSARADGRGGATHKHGSQECIVAFLGEKNWDRNKVRGLLYLVPLDDDAKALIVDRNPSGRHESHPSNHLEDDSTVLEGADEPDNQIPSRRISHNCFDCLKLTAG